MNDDDLKKRFRELKRADAKRAPSFDAMVSKRPRTRLPLLIAISPFVAAAAVFLLWCGASVTERAAPLSAVRPAPAIRVQAAAQLPLDFLLDSAPIGVNLDAKPIPGFKP